MSIQPKSSSLFHFTRNAENLKGILSKGFLPRYSLEDTSFIRDVPFAAYPMVCFCDIPISRISEHTAFYGNYGVGLTKNWGSKNSLQPLIYTLNKGPTPAFLNYVIDLEVQKKTVDPQVKEILTHFERILPFVKPISGNMLVGGKTVEKDFYQENEWRYVPNKYQIAFQDQLEKSKDDLNKSVESSKLEFLPSDVKYIFVKSESEIPDLFDFIEQKLGHWPHNDIKILLTRITSLDTLSRDV
jgi:hypothetical protein